MGKPCCCVCAVKGAVARLDFGTNKHMPTAKTWVSPAPNTVRVRPLQPARPCSCPHRWLGKVVGSARGWAIGRSCITSQGSVALWSQERGDTRQPSCRAGFCFFWLHLTDNCIGPRHALRASLAQSVERETLNLKVAGSTPAWGFFCFFIHYLLSNSRAVTQILASWTEATGVI
jgi:hypothetical protein